MRAWKVVAVVAVVVAARFAPKLVQDGRGLKIIDTEPARVEEAQSAGLFVGVRKFAHKDVVEVRFAADDAVDLAYLFALDARVKIIPPPRVVLALSGQPQKEESRQRLQKLKEAGARIESAEPDKIVRLLEEQTNVVGADGILVVSIATHGFVDDGVPHILGSTSRFDLMTLPMTGLFDIAARAPRSLIFVDACRERMSLGTRSGSSDPATAAPLLERIKKGPQGQAIFFAAAAGGWAYDGDGNGVFTKAVLDGLRCNASSQEFVTVEKLQAFVEHEVRDWIIKNKNPSIGSATQISVDGSMRLLPLAQCPPPSSNAIDRVRHKGSTVTAINADGSETWTKDVGGEVVRAEVEDLNADGLPEVIVAGLERLVTIAGDGTRIETAQEGLELRGWDTDGRLGKATRQIVALWRDAQKSRLVTYDASWNVLQSHDDARLFEEVMFYRPTKRHTPRVVVASRKEVVQFDKRKQEWTYPLSSPVKKLATGHCNDDNREDIMVTTARGRVCIDVKGKTLTP